MGPCLIQVGCAWLVILIVRKLIAIFNVFCASLGIGWKKVNVLMIIRIVLSSLVLMGCACCANKAIFSLVTFVSSTPANLSRIATSLTQAIQVHLQLSLAFIVRWAINCFMGSAMPRKKLTIMINVLLFMVNTLIGHHALI